MSGSLAAVAPGAGIRGVPNQNIRAVNDGANPNLQGQQAGGVPPQSPQGQVPPALLAAMLQQRQAQQGGQPGGAAGGPAQGQAPAVPQQPAPSARIQLQSQTPVMTGSVPAIPTASPASKPQPSPDAMRLFAANADPRVGQLADKGRNGDTHVVHAQTGELNIPTRVQTPALMNALHGVFAQHGLNMHQFIVGHPAGSINPKTGAQEFAGVAIGQQPTTGVVMSPQMGGGAVSPLADGQNSVLSQLTSQQGGAGRMMGGGGMSGGGMSGGGSSSGMGNLMQMEQLGESLGNTYNKLSGGNNSGAFSNGAGQSADQGFNANTYGNNTGSVAGSPVGINMGNYGGSQDFSG